jgi:DNA-binding transcriptional ArsR family regulator
MSGAEFQPPRAEGWNFRLGQRPPSIAKAAMANSEAALERWLHAIADPSRRKILRVLKQHPGSSAKAAGLCASHIEQRIHLAQSTISHHLSILRKAGLVDARKSGLWTWYRRDEAALRRLARKLEESL